MDGYKQGKGSRVLLALGLPPMQHPLQGQPRDGHRWPHAILQSENKDGHNETVS